MSVVGRLTVLNVRKVVVDSNVSDPVPFGVGLGQNEQLHLILVAGLLQDLDEAKERLELDVLAIDLNDHVVLAQATGLGGRVVDNLDSHEFGHFLISFYFYKFLFFLFVHVVIFSLYLITSSISPLLRYILHVFVSYLI